MIFATALANFAAYRSANRFAAVWAWVLPSAPQVSAKAVFAPGCADYADAARSSHEVRERGPDVVVGACLQPAVRVVPQPVPRHRLGTG